MMIEIPSITLNTGAKMPIIGQGTFGSDKYTPDQIAQAVYGAVSCGCRLIDCAEVYGNEAEIGQTLRRLMEDKVVTREELFITSKVWNDHHRNVRAACEGSLEALGLAYVDLYFIHWPFPNYHAPGCSGDARNPDSKPFSVEEFVDTYRQCEELYNEGKIRAIGISNMTVSKLQTVLPHLKVMPAAMEMELHLAFQQKELLRFALDHGIRPIGFCPLGSPSRPERDKTSQDVAAMEMPVIQKIAWAHGIHPSSVCLKWASQMGAVPIPFSVKQPQYQANFRAVCEDPLTREEMEQIANADCNCRLIKGQVFLWEGATDWQELWT